MAALRQFPRSPLGSSGSEPQADMPAREEASSARAAADGRFWPLLVLLALCQLADLVTFNLAVEEFGPAGELGPMGLLYRIGGFWAVAIVKLGLIGGVMAVLARYPWQRVATRRRVALIVAAIGGFGALTNMVTFVWLR